MGGKTFVLGLALFGVGWETIGGKTFVLGLALFGATRQPRLRFDGEELRRVFFAETWWRRKRTAGRERKTFKVRIEMKRAGAGRERNSVIRMRWKVL
jgi:hypothetical protein